MTKITLNNIPSDMMQSAYRGYKNCKKRTSFALKASRNAKKELESTIHAAMQAAVGYLAAHPNEWVLNRDLARACGMTPSAFHQHLYTYVRRNRQSSAHVRMNTRRVERKYISPDNPDDFIIFHDRLQAWTWME